MKIIKFNRNLYLLLCGQLISQIGDKFYALGLAYWVLQTTGSSSMMGLVLFFSMAPAIVAGFFSGKITSGQYRSNQGTCCNCGGCILLYRNIESVYYHSSRSDTFNLFCIL